MDAGQFWLMVSFRLWRFLLLRSGIIPVQNSAATQSFDRGLENCQYDGFRKLPFKLRL